ncbi:pirin [Burkholderia cepacia]|uniref:pirin family protein n=1 Tax=Burkholderia cepacia TaxID=292 RepID=UPI0007526B21|nr:pirin family protein [Burkholderia cepacia]KVV23235.1 pirin [Burkholderia cepacia]
METVFRLVRRSIMTRESHFHAEVLRGRQDTAPIDPFLGVDHARISAPTFPPHPHAGFSAVSYVFPDSPTGILNRDSLGTRNLIEPGGLHWTTAGRGIIHEEVPAEPGKTCNMLQIFVNLATRDQQMHPFTLSVRPQSVPVACLAGARVRIPLGRLGGSASPMSPPTDVSLFDITLDAGAQLTLPILAGNSAFLLPILGVTEIAGMAFEQGAIDIPVFVAHPFEREISLSAPLGPARVVMFSGKPLHQEVYWHGSIAMASTQMRDAAVIAFERGEFGTLY